MNFNNISLSSISLTDAQIRKFKDYGYLVIRGGYSDSEVKIFQRWSNALLALPEETGKHWVYREVHSDEKNAKII